MIIDSHAHLVPPLLLDAVRDRKTEFSAADIIEKDGSVAFSFAGRKATRPVAGKLSDLEKRVAWMDAQGIERQVVAGWLDMFGYELPGDEGAAWSRMINDALSAQAKADARFVPMGTVPLQNGAAAAAELEHLHAQGVKGVMIGTQPKGKGGVLDDPALDPFWQAADRLGAVVAIHPVFDSGDDRVGDYGMNNAVGRITDTLIAVSRLIFSGHVQRYAGAKIVVGIGGAALPYALGRLRRNYRMDSDNLADPDTALRAMYYDTIVQDHGALRLLVETVGADRVMMGSDMPFPIGDLEPLDLIASHDFTEAERASINGGLVARLLDL
ncbi:MAG: amidohydrolase family protein [Pseudomonadota bacterium]